MSVTLTNERGEAQSFDLSKEQADKMRESEKAMLVDRFDALACNDAEPRFMGRQDGEAGPFVLRRYDAPTSCVDQLKGALDRLGFVKTGLNAYAGGSSDGTTERLRFFLGQQRTQAEIQWEIDVE